MSDITLTIRTSNHDFALQREADLRSAGFATTLVTIEPIGEYEHPRDDVYTFQAEVDFEFAHLLTRDDDRWTVANQFFQIAENAENKRGWYATLASDWSSFGFEKYTLTDYLVREHARQADCRASMIAARA